MLPIDQHAAASVYPESRAGRNNTLTPAQRIVAESPVYALTVGFAAELDKFAECVASAAIDETHAQVLTSRVGGGALLPLPTLEPACGLTDVDARICTPAISLHDDDRLIALLRDSRHGENQCIDVKSESAPKPR